ARAGDGPLDQQQPVVGVDAVHREVLRGDARVAHPTGHAQALEDPARGGAATDGARRAVLALRAVARAEAAEAVALHDTRGALALAGADHVDLRAGVEHVGGDLLPDAVLGRVGGPQLDEVPARGDTRLGEVAAARLVHLARVDRAVGELHGGVTVGLRSADLRHHVRARLDHGDRHHPVVLVEDLGHPELRAQDPGDLSFGHRSKPYWMFTSTLAGRSMRISASTVFGVGSRMSISRLWVRISKCSRESLYLCGERMTQYTFFSVGSGTGPTTRAP